ncbi:MFS transporter [Actinoplanes derwentensis]|uniref:Drug resistance transporter, EmrB/QacA subfamily n=1 Tax=Actinoplanes derwentensis TaxID=113562 RepID=A0A1H2APC4_9ACTN|nr:MFS transporter [Actinoplanes derwentensis]GID84408.1 MFS transporter [Actinoplanes derwentensis]SDT47875.1 drug resistance transporter, EmrB/QacA subfamily [Actinoplanes derwentensis]
MRKWSPLIAVCLGTFLLLVDVTIVIVALPSIAGHLKAGPHDLTWILDGYALALAALLLGAGALADRYGRRRTYVIGLVIFALSSLLCALAPTVPALIAARVVQGVGGAAMFATTVAILNVTYQGRDRGTAFGVWGAVSGAATAAGPLAGGLLTEHLDWRWIFLVNLPVCVAAVWFTLRTVTESRAERAGRFDIPGTVTFTLAATAIVYALIRAAADGWTSPAVLGLLTAGFAGIAVFVLVERRSEHPMLDLDLFRRLPFTGLIVAAFLCQAAAFAYLPFTTTWLQQVLGYGPVDAGLLGALPLSGAALLVGVFAGRHLQGFDPRITISGGLLAIAAGAFAQTIVSDSAFALIPGLILVGLGSGVVMPVLSSAVLAEVPRDRSGMAGGALNTFRQLGFAFGVAIYGTVFREQNSYAADLSRVTVLAGVFGLVAAFIVVVAVRRRVTGPVKIG